MQASTLLCLIKLFIWELLTHWSCLTTSFSLEKSNFDRIFFYLHHQAFKILVPQPGIELTLSSESTES